MKRSLCLVPFIARILRIFKSFSRQHLVFPQLVSRLAILAVLAIPAVGSVLAIFAIDAIFPVGSVLAIFAIDAIFPVGSVLAILAFRRNAQILWNPVHYNPPVAIIPNVRNASIGTVFTICSIFPVVAVNTIFAVGSVLAIFAVDSVFPVFAVDSVFTVFPVFAVDSVFPSRWHIQVCRNPIYHNPPVAVLTNVRRVTVIAITTSQEVVEISFRSLIVRP